MMVDDGDNNEPIWDTQFLHSNDLEDEIPEYDDLGNPLPPSTVTDPLGITSPGGTMGEEEDLLAATQGQLRRVKVENVNYAKRAKRVDVKRLKDAIWKELEGVVVRVDEVRSFILSFFSFHCVILSVEGGGRAERCRVVLTSLCDSYRPTPRSRHPFSHQQTQPNPLPPLSPIQLSPPPTVQHESKKKPSPPSLRISARSTRKKRWKKFRRRFALSVYYISRMRRD